jgi:outer membrane protein TolC
MNRLLMIFLIIAASELPGQTSGERCMSPDDCVATALSNNPDIRNAKISLQQNKLDNIKLLGRYLPNLTGSWMRTDINEPVSISTFNQYPLETQSFSPSVSLGIPGGGAVTATWLDQISESSGYYGGRQDNATRKLTLSFVQPLLKDFFLLPSDVNILRMASVSRHIAELALEQAKQNIGYSIYTSYFNVLVSELNLTVRSNSLERSRILLEQNEKNRSLGIVEDTDLLAARAALALRTAELANARQIRDDLADSLRVLVNVEKNVCLDLEAEKRLETPEKAESLESETAVALSNRTELILLKEQIRMQKIQISILRSRTLPQVNLNGSMSWYGNTNNTRKAQEIFDSGKYKSWTFGVTYSVPLVPVSDFAELRKQELELQRLQNNLDRTSDQIRNQVASRMREAETLSFRLGEVRRAVSFQEEKLKKEQEKYKVGRSSTRLVLQYQDDLETAEMQELQLRLQYTLSLVSLRFVQGRFLDPRTSPVGNP